MKKNKFQIGQRLYFYGQAQEVVAITADSRTGDQESVIIRNELSGRKQEVRIDHWGFELIEEAN